MTLVVGNNLFGQWFESEYLLPEFKAKSPTRNINNVDDTIELVEINWSYNIYRTEKSFYVSGAWRDKENQFIEISLPEACKKFDSKDLLLSGNDYKLILIHKMLLKLWIMDIEDNNVREISFNEVKHTSSKKRKEYFSITKAISTNNSLLCLTDSGDVYNGLLPTLVNTEDCIGTVCDIQCGHEHFMLLTDSGSVYTWGNGRRLQLGHGDLDNQDTPTEVEALAGIKIIKISAGGWHSMALSEFGDLYVWGWNDTGQLGNKGTSLNSCSIPTLVNIYDGNEEEVSINIKDIACGSRHSVLLLEDNTVWTAGNNKYDQLGFSCNLYPKINCFKLAYKCDNNLRLVCGPWSTALIK